MSNPAPRRASTSSFWGGLRPGQRHLDNYAEEVSYFDPILKELVVGRDKVIAHLESIQWHIVHSHWAFTQTATEAIAS